MRGHINVCTTTTAGSRSQRTIQLHAFVLRFASDLPSKGRSEDRGYEPHLRQKPRTCVGSGHLTLFASLFSLCSCLSPNYDDTSLERFKVLWKRTQHKRAPSGRPYTPSFFILGTVMVYWGPIICVATIVCNRVYFLHSPCLLKREPPYAVGQRSCLIATAPVLTLTPFGIPDKAEGI